LVLTVFGGKLTVLRYPEKELVSVPALEECYAPAKPFLEETAAGSSAVPLSQQQELVGLLDIGDVIGKRIVDTRLHANVTVREENAVAALEVMSRFAVNQKWLIYLPPTMSPCETSAEPGLLEHPAEAFEYYRKAGVEQAICEQKHMGSRAVVIVCRDRDAARKRFGVARRKRECATPERGGDSSPTPASNGSSWTAPARRSIGLAFG
jgi:protein phosphatase